MSQPTYSLRADSRPLYVQAVDALYELIEAGIYRPGQPLPSEAELAAHLGVSRSTIREALSHLEKDGLIVRKQGVGTFMAPHSSQISGGLERLASFRSVAELAGATVQIIARTVSRTHADDLTANSLQVPPGSDVIQVQVIEAVDDCQMAYLEGFVAPELVNWDQVVADTGSLLEYLSQHTDLPLAYSRSAIYAIEADPALAERLGVGAGRAVLHLAETVYSDADIPVAFFRNYFITDCYNFKIVRRIVRSSSAARRAAQRGAEHGTV